MDCSFQQKEKLKNYVWVKKFEITAYNKREAIEEMKMNFDSNSVMISGRDLEVDLEYVGTEKPTSYDVKMYEYRGNEYSENPKKMTYPKETSQERKERISKWATELR